MKKIPTLFSNYDELMLDIDVYGRKVLNPQLTMAQLREKLFEDFKRSKPLPTLTSRRYELSNLVSEDYRILYIKELELQENESEIDLKDNRSSSSFNFDFNNLEPISSKLQVLFTYENRTTDADRDAILQKYNLVTGEEFTRGVAETEKIFGSVVEDKSLVLNDDEIENLCNTGQDENMTDNVETGDSYPKVEEDNSDDDYPDFEEDESDDDYPDFDEEDEDEDYPDFEEDEDEANSDDDEDYPDFEEDEDEGNSDDDDPDFSEDDNSSDDEYLDDYPEFEEDNNSDDYPDFSEDDSDDDYPDFSEDDSDESNSPEKLNEEDENNSSSSKNSGYNTSSIEVDEDLSDFTIEFDEPKPINVPKTPVQIVNTAPEEEEKVDRSLEPTDIRQFLRKHPRSTIEFVSKYFTKKQINDALRIGKIIKKGNILKLP